MRKNIIALMLALPLLFVFVVFSSGSVASLGVTVSATGIEILGKPENDTLRLDLATYQNDHTLSVEVLPATASDKSYTFRVEDAEGAKRADVTVDEAGRVSAHSPGVARVVAVSNDGGFTDSITVVVGCSKPYDFEFSLGHAEGGAVQLQPQEGGYAASVQTGLYSYRTVIEPSGFSGAKVACEEGFAVVNEATGTVLFPFGGDVRLSASVEGGWKGDIVKQVQLTVSRVVTGAGFTVNGGAGATLAYEKGTREGSFYVEADAAPTLSSTEFLEGYTVNELGSGTGRYRVDLAFPEHSEDYFELKVNVGENSETVAVSFLEFAFEVRSDLPVQEDGRASVLVGSPATFYAYPSQGMEAKGVTYEWTADADERQVTLTPAQDGGSCTVLASESASFRLTVRAMRGGSALDINAKEIDIESVRNVTALQFVGRYDVGLSRRTTLAGFTCEGERTVECKTPLRVAAYDVDSEIDGFDAVDFEISNEAVARLERTADAVMLVPTGTGEVTVTASWRGNANFGADVRAAVTFNVAHTAVEVKTSAQLYRVAAEGKPIVLGADIMLGTNDEGTPLPEGERMALFGTMRSTYNINFYTSGGTEDAPEVKYAVEFKNNVYGNGHTLDAEYLTHVVDGTGVPKAGFFRGPLYFVSLGTGDTISVAGQDNIAFLVRTDGVVLSDLTLLGCSDSSLFDGEAQNNDLSKLNNVGTVLELNANVSVLNCRVRNGRNVVRAYGGNRDGSHYFVESLGENAGCDGERIHVRVEGCILSHAREFILKIGANRALRASGSVAGEAEPDLLKADGTAYPFLTDENLGDPYFYERYVMTDVVLKDSVLETSGLFTVGVESNFSGAMLYADMSGTGFQGWKGTGATSFASILRLEGDVRLYDWKRLDLVDSSTLIQSTGGDARFSLDIAAMLNFVCGAHPDAYGDIIEEKGGEQYVHGGIAFYGGGKNYSMLSAAGLDGKRADFSAYRVNVSVLAESEDETMQNQGRLLPAAAGTQDFRFFMYGKSSANNYEAQLTSPNYEVGALSPFTA